ncbi:MAG: hypothetical protein ABR562_00510 [Thermoplasmatota archaeon]|nr:hypothetical protein [Halobacteriales archaeon]
MSCVGVVNGVALTIINYDLTAMTCTFLVTMTPGANVGSLDVSAGTSGLSIAAPPSPVEFTLDLTDYPSALNTNLYTTDMA